MAAPTPTMVVATMLLLLACTAQASTLRRGLLQTVIVAPNTTGVELAGFTFGSEVGSESQPASRHASAALALHPRAAACSSVQRGRGLQLCWRLPCACLIAPSEQLPSFSKLHAPCPRGVRCARSAPAHRTGPILQPTL
jgi:hypothetical protein